MLKYLVTNMISMNSNYSSKIKSIVFFVFLLFLSSCRESNQIKVGVCVTETTRPVYTRMKKAMLENEERLGVKVIWVGLKDGKRRVNYSSYQENIVYRFFEEGIQALIFNPIEDQTVYSLVYNAKDRGIPVIALDKLLEDLRFDAYITTNEKEMGKQAASYLVEKIQGSGNVIVLEGPPGDKKKRDIVLGFYKILDQYPDIRIVSSPHLSEISSTLSKEEIQRLKKKGLSEDEIRKLKKRKAASDHVSLMLTKYANNIQGVIACDSALIAGAVKAIDAYDLEDLVVTVGVGASKEACSLLRPYGPRVSKHDMELYSGNFDRGLMALETAVKLINGESIEYDTMLLNGEVEVKTLYGPIRKLTYQDYYSKVKDLWPELFVEKP